MARASTFPLLTAAMMAAMMAPGVAACDCTSGVVGAVLGTFFGTLLLGAAILLILWFCCLRQRLERNRNAESNYEIPECPPPVPHDMHGHVHRDSLWGVPSALKKYLKKCSLPPDSVHQIKLERNPDGDTLDFSVASRGVGLFLKDIDTESKLSHIHHLEEGAHILGFSVAFDSWSAEAAAEFLSRAAPFKPQLHVRCAPLFVVDGLEAFRVLSAPPARAPPPAPFPEPRASVSDLVAVQSLPQVEGEGEEEDEEELVFAEIAHRERSALPLPDSRASSVGFESIELSEEHPAELRLSGSLTYDRSNEVQPERILIARRSVDVASSDEDRTMTPHGSLHHFSVPPGFENADDIYRATPLHLEPDDDMSELDIGTPSAPLDFADFRTSHTASPLDSGFGTGAFAINGTGGLSSSEASQDPVPRPPPSMSGSSSPPSVLEEPIKQAVNPRAQLAPRLRPDPHHSELSELDRKIALNNVEIATLMLNDSHNRLANNEARFSESEPESAHEEQISPKLREQVLPRGGGSQKGFENAAFEVEPTVNGEAGELGAKVNFGYNSEEAFA